MVPRYGFVSTPSSRNAASQTSILSWSSHESKRAPARYARSSTAPSRRSPRAKTPSSHEVSQSCILRSTPLVARRSSCSQPCFWRTASAVSMAHHWNGVCGLGTCVDTLTVTAGAPPPLAFPCSRSAFFTLLPTRRARSPTCTISRTSASSSVGRPIMK